MTAGACRSCSKAGAIAACVTALLLPTPHLRTRWSR